MPQKLFLTLFELNIGQKMLRFWKVTSKNLKIWKLSVASAISNFQELFIMKSKSKSSWFQEKSLFFKRFITKKTRGGAKMSTPPRKMGLI